MASLDISPQIGRSYQTLVSSPAPANKSPTYAQWAVFAVSAPLQNAFVASSASKASTLKVHSTGEGELEDLIEEFNDGKVQFAFVKVRDPNSGLPKFVLIAWCGEGVPEMVKGYFTAHLNAASKVLHGYHIQVTARSESDLSPDSIVQKVGDASGAKYSSSSTSATPPAPARKPAVPSSKPAYQPTRVSGSTTSRAPYRRDEKTDSDGWGADAPPVSRSQLEKVAPAYRPTKVDISAIRAQPTSTTSGFGGTSSAGDRPEVVRGAYQPIGKVDIAAIIAQAQQKSDRPDIVKGAYEPVGRVDIAAIRAQARPRSPAQQRNEDEGDKPKPLAERSAAFSQSERLTSLPKPKPAKKFGTGAPGFGTKPPTPGGFGLGPSVPAAPPVGTASRDFGSSGGKTPAQLWAEKKARERGLSGASETTPPTLSPGYTGQHYAPVSTSHTGRSSGSNDGQSAKFSQQRSDDHDEDIQAPAGGISALRNMFSGAPPMGAPTSPKSPPRTGGYQFQQTTGDRAPPLDTSSRPTVIAGGAAAIPGFPPRHTEDTGESTAAGIPRPPIQPPRSPTPPTPELPGSPIRIAMPVGRGDPVRRHDPEPESSIPIESLSRVVPHEDNLEDEGPVPIVGGAAGRQALILFDYEATEENEIDLIEGQVVGEVDMVDEDWWAGRNAAGERGLFPSNYVELIEATSEEEHAPPLPPPATRPVAESPAPEEEHQSSGAPSAIAQYDYEATEENELTFPEEAIIEDLEFPDDDWWLGTYGGKRGLFPANYVVLRDFPNQLSLVCDIQRYYMYSSSRVRTRKEVHEALKVSSNTSAPGPDTASYLVWKNVHRACPTIIPDLLNPLLKHGYHPLALKKAFGIVLPKPGKPSYESHTSFRIIVLLETISKILERITATRLFNFAKSAGLLSPNQVGSVKGLSTADGISLLQHEVTLLQASGLKVSTLFLDIKGGFDNVDAKILAQTLRKRNTPEYMVQWISSFLSDRECTLLFTGSPKISLPVTVGTPQGSPISPLLFLIYVAPMHSDPHTGICISYVDDFAISAAATSHQRATAILAYEHKRMEAIGAARKVLFSVEKTELIHWRTPKDRSPTSTNPITINGRIFAPKKEIRWLGYWLTPNFNSTSHYHKRIAAANKTFALVRRFSTAGKGFTPANARRLATMAILPILTYGAAALPPNVQSVNKMTVAWNKVERWVTNCFRATHIAILPAEIAFPPIKAYTSSLHLRHAARVARASPAYNPVAARMPASFQMISPYRAISHRNLLASKARPSKPREWNDPNKNRRNPLPIDTLAALAHPLVGHQPNALALRILIRDRLLKDWRDDLPTPAYYPYELTTKVHPFMALDKFIAGRIHQFRAHQSYLAGHPSWLHPNRRTICPRCENEDETFEHAILHCPARDSERADHLPKVNSLSELWQSEANLKNLALYLRATKTGFPTTAFLETTPPRSEATSSPASSELSSTQLTLSDQHFATLFPGWGVPTQS